MIDADGYPTEQTLDIITNFNPFTDNLDRFIDYLMSNWINGYPPEFDKEDGILKLSTAGWSGCESVIEALQQNHTFWTLFWYSTTRGGHYVFKFKQ
jgi:hypothetical protein